MKTIIVTKHKPAVEWLAKHGITGEVIEHVTDPAQIRGAHVIGNLPVVRQNSISLLALTVSI